MLNILPYEVKLSTLKKTKSFDLHKQIIEEILEKFNAALSEDSFKEILLELEDIAYLVQENYVEELYHKFEEKLSSKILEDVKCSIINSNFIEAINVIENELEINSIATSDVIEDMEKHINDDIYKTEYKRLHNILEDFREAFKYFNEDMSKALLNNSCPKCEIILNEQVSKEEYLVYVVYNETWNFLSHMSFAIANFETPKIYISNIDKGVSHLRRAILDIYDGLILETQEINEEYLSIRTLKLHSLGNNDKITSLSDTLKNHYLKYRNRS